MGSEGPAARGGGGACLLLGSVNSGLCPLSGPKPHCETRTNCVSLLTLEPNPRTDLSCEPLPKTKFKTGTGRGTEDPSPTGSHQTGVSKSQTAKPEQSWHLQSLRGGPEAIVGLVRLPGWALAKPQVQRSDARSSGQNQGLCWMAPARGSPVLQRRRPRVHPCLLLVRVGGTSAPACPRIPRVRPRPWPAAQQRGPSHSVIPAEGGADRPAAPSRGKEEGASSKGGAESGEPGAFRHPHRPP